MLSEKNTLFTINASLLPELVADKVEAVILQQIQGLTHYQSLKKALN